MSESSLAALAGRIGGLFGSTSKRIDKLEARMAELEKRKDIPTMKFRGTWNARCRYVAGDVITDGGGLWICKQTTGERPGGNNLWQLIVKRGRNGRDAR